MRRQAVQALNEMIFGKAHGPSDLSFEFIAASREV